MFLVFFGRRGGFPRPGNRPFLPARLILPRHRKIAGSPEVGSRYHPESVLRPRWPEGSGVSRARVNQLLRLLKLPKSVIRMGDPLISRAITEHKLRALLTSPQPEQKKVGFLLLRKPFLEMPGQEVATGKLGQCSVGAKDSEVTNISGRKNAITREQQQNRDRIGTVPFHQKHPFTPRAWKQILSPSEPLRFFQLADGCQSGYNGRIHRRNNQ